MILRSSEGNGRSGVADFVIYAAYRAIRPKSMTPFTLFRADYSVTLER